MFVETTSIRLPDGLARQLDELAAGRRTTRSELIREAIESYCAAARTGQPTDRVALVRRLVDYEGSGRGDLAERSETYLRARFDERRQRRRTR